MNQKEVFKNLEDAIVDIQRRKAKPVRIAINGIEGTGKTTFAKNLTEYLSGKGRNALHITIDGFHFKTERRYAQGRYSAKGYYEDSYNEEAFVEKVLKMSQQSTPAYVPAIHDLESDEYIDLEPIKIPSTAILIVDGAYLFKPSYMPHWDLKIYLKTDFETALNRAIGRDDENLANPDATKQRYADRYHAASKIYIRQIKPERIADRVIDNTAFGDLKVVL